jgi:hypothetical protein
MEWARHCQMQSESFICQMILTEASRRNYEEGSRKGKEGKENFLSSLPFLLPSYSYLRRLLFGIGFARTRHCLMRASFCVW